MVQLAKYPWYRTWTKQQGRESDLQKSTNRWMTYAFRNEFLYFHTPNGGFRRGREGGMLVAEGVKNGVPDWMICKAVNYTQHRSWRHWNGIMHYHASFVGLAIELKVYGGKVSKGQRERLEQLKREGWATYIAWSFEEFESVVNYYLAKQIIKPNE